MDNGLHAKKGSTKHENLKKWKQSRDKKRKRTEEMLISERVVEEQEPGKKANTEKIPRAASAGRSWTVSMALPGSILTNAQTHELQSYLAGQIARAAAVFNVDEIIVFNEDVKKFDKVDMNARLGRILQYLECPQYLRKALFPHHNDLKFVGLTNPLDCPHHMRESHISEYREGVVLNSPLDADGGCRLTDIGLARPAKLDVSLPPNTRVTVRLFNCDVTVKKVKGTAVSPSEPRRKQGLYWGYTVRMADGLGAVFSECPYSDGYDVTVGTSERGSDVDTFTMPRFQHLLVVFGGLRGLEASLDFDQKLKADDPADLFHHYLNTCPSQGSRTIRTEEAILVTLSALRPKIQKVQA